MGLLKIGKISANIGEDELKVEDVKIDFVLTSACQYESLTAGDGKRMYHLQKDPSVKFGDKEQQKIVLTVIDVPSGDNKDNLEKLRGYLADTTNKDNHEGYGKHVALCFLNAAEEVTLCIKFLGCVSQIINIPADRVKAAQYEVTLLILDMDTLNFDN